MYRAHFEPLISHIAFKIKIQKLFGHLGEKALLVLGVPPPTESVHDILVVVCGLWLLKQRTS